MLCDLIIRAFFSVSLGIPFLQSQLLVLKYYPEMRPYLLNEGIPGSDHPRILVLGGSAAHTSFCNLDQQINRDSEGNYFKKFELDTLAQYAQNSLDSWYKYKLLEKLKFKYIIFYHGINDARTNNCPKEYFDLDYRHISFYNELFILFRHPEIKFTMIPWFSDFVIQKFKEKTGLHKTIPKEYNVMEFYFRKTANEDPGWKYGNELKSKASFSRNLTNILNLAEKKGDSVLVVSYAWFQPENYSLQKFIDKQLGYTEHKWPTELYGSPINVKAGIIAHNVIGKELASNFYVARAVDFEGTLPKKGEYFFDICHLTQAGCEEMGKKIRSNIFP